MTQTVRNFLKSSLRNEAGKLRYQKYFEMLLRVAVGGMNIGGGGSTANSGEVEVLRYARRKLPRGGEPVVLDVGANCGEYSRSVLEIFPAETRIYAFEPSKATAETLRKTLEGSPVRICNIGLGAEAKTLTLYTNREGSGIASLYHRRLDHVAIAMDIQEDVTIETLDAFCKGENIDHVFFLKLDVEGHELSVLQGGSQLLAAKAIDFIQFEFGGSNIDSRTFFQDFYYLLSPDYNLYRIVKDGLRPILRYGELHEIFTTTNFLAERKGL